MTVAAILHWDALGGFTWAALNDFEVVCVDERTPEDRVYRSVGRLSPDVAERVISGEFRDLVDAANAARGPR